MFFRILFFVFLIAFAPAFAEQKELPKEPPKALVDEWCTKVREESRGLRWDLEPCQDLNWKIKGASVSGIPLVYTEFGSGPPSNTTLIFSMVHGDEVTPFYLGIQLAHWIKAHENELKSSRIVIAPLVNPDGFFKKPKTRVNRNGVDLNRNFSTQDWKPRALQTWKRRYRSDPRRYPGSASSSEPETLFQEELIRQYKPQKILSIHAPLNFLDYDGPTRLALAKFPKDYVKECLRLRSRLKAVSGGFFPGSLGNYAGQEMGIPTLTLELPSADPKRAKKYWEQFKSGIRTMIEFRVPDLASRQMAPDGG